MVLMTFQHKNVVNVLNKQGKYYCEVNSLYSEEAPKMYQYLKELITEKTGVSSKPIFGWSRLLDCQNNSIDLSSPSYDSIYQAISKVPYHGDSYYLFILDVPDNLIVHHDFYDFACFKADEFEELCTDEDLKNFIYNSVISDKRDTQSCFPYIDKSFVIGVYEFCVERIDGVKISDLMFREIDWCNKDNRFIEPSYVF